MSELKLLVGQSPAEMAEAQKGMLAWCAVRRMRAEHQIKQLNKDIACAEEAGLKTSSMKAARSKEGRRKVGYEKIRAALEAGYYLVPNFPIEWFAVRRREEYPRHVEARYDTSPTLQQKPGALAIGEGRFVDIDPFTDMDTRGPEGHERDVYFPIAFDEAISPPAALVKAGLLPALTKALQEKVFDAIGMVPHRRVNKGKDPMLLGMVNFGKEGYTDKHLTFLIAWWMDFESF